MNTDFENKEPAKQPAHKHSRFWVRLSIAIVIIITTLWLVFYFFSNILFSTAIKRSFSALTKQNYSLSFNNFNINILTRKIVFFETRITKTTNDDSISKGDISLYADTLLFKNIHILDFSTKRLLKLNKIYIHKLKLKIEESAKENDSDKLFLPLNSYLKQFEVLNFKVADAEISYKQNTDSVYIPSLNFEIINFRLDSIKDTVVNNRIHYADFAFGLKNQKFDLPDKIHRVFFEEFKLSSKEKSLELTNFNLNPNSKTYNKTSYSVEIPKFKLEGLDFDSLIKKKIFLAKICLLDINYFNVVVPDLSNANKNNNLKTQLDKLLTNYFNGIQINNSQIVLNKSQILLPNNERINLDGESKLFVDNFQFQPENKSCYSIFDATLSLNDLSYSKLKIKQNIHFKEAHFNYKNAIVSFEDIKFVSDSTANLNLNLKKAILKKIDWNDLLNSGNLVAENLVLTEGDLTQRKSFKSQYSPAQLTKSDSPLFSIFPSIKINDIQFSDWNYSLASKAIKATNMNAQFLNVQLSDKLNLEFGAFSDFNTQINQLSWVSKDQKHHYLANDIKTNSVSQNISIQEIQSFPRWKTLKNQPLSESARYKLLLTKINIKTQKAFHQIRLSDTLILTNLSIDSINLKQYGKNVSKEKFGSEIPQISILSFDLNKGDFAAYNDSSVVSRLTQINGIQLHGDSLDIYNDSLFSLNYKHLIARTKNGFYQNKARGLNFNFQKINFDSKNQTMGMYQVKAELSSDTENESSLHQLDSKLMEIKGFDHNLFLRRNLITAQEFKLNAPKIVSKSRSVSKSQPEDFQHFFSAENLQNLPYLEFDKFIIHDLTWLATFTTKDVTNITSFDKANFEAIDFRLSHRSFTNPDRLFFSKSIEFNIQNFRQHLNNGNYLLMVDDINFSSFKKQLDFEKIQFYTLQNENQNNYIFNIKRISLNDINFADYQYNYSLSVNTLFIQNPVTEFRVYGFSENSSLNNLNTINLYPILQPYFSQITLNRIDIQDMNLKLETPIANSTNTYNLGQVNLQILNFKLDSTTQAFKNNRFFYSENTIVYLRDYSARIANDMYAINFKNLRLSTLKSMLEIDSISLKPQYNYADFAERSVYQTDRFDIDIQSVKLSGIDFQDAVFREKYTVRRADINHLKGEAYRDGLYPRPLNHQTLNPIQRLLDLPYFIQIDSLLVNDSYFAYKEKGENTEVPGHIYFDQMNVEILNATNNPDFIKYGGSTLLDANTMLMGKGKLNLNVIFPLLAQGKSFELRANLGKIELDDLDPILRPLALIQAKSGTIKSVDLDVIANDDYAYGNMLMLYDNLKLELLTKSMKKGFFGTLFANALIKTENPSYLIPRKGPIYFERNKERSLFNYWAEISILGMKTSMGLADRRIGKKVKKIKKLQEK